MPVVLRLERIDVVVDQAAARRVASQFGFTLVTDTARQVLNRATVLTPVKTGNLRGHNRMRVQRTATRIAAEVFNEASYVEAVHDGSRPHTIRARGRALRFVAGGRTLYRRQVRHPGTRARPFLEQAGREVAAAAGFRWSRG